MDDIRVYKGSGKMIIKQYDAVLLKDGRRGCVIEVNSDENFDIDVGSSPKDWETLYRVSIDEIEKVLEE